MKKLTLIFMLALSALAQPQPSVTWAANGITFAATDVSYPDIWFLSNIKSGIRVCVPDRAGSIRTLALTVYYTTGSAVAYGTFMMPYAGTQDGQTCFQTLFKDFTAEQIIGAVAAPSPVILSPESNGGAR